MTQAILFSSFSSFSSFSFSHGRNVCESRYCCRQCRPLARYTLSSSLSPLLTSPLFSSLSPLFSGKKADSNRTHKWICFVRGPSNEDLSYFIRKVVILLHSSFEKSKRGTWWWKGERKGERECVLERDREKERQRRRRKKEKEKEGERKKEK